MSTLPSLPPAGALRLLAVAGSLALLGFLLAFSLELAARRYRGAAWALAPLLTGLATMLLGHEAPRLHALTSFLTLGLALRNAIVFRRGSRAAEIAAIAGWITAIACARWLFGGAA